MINTIPNKFDKIFYIFVINIIFIFTNNMYSIEFIKSENTSKEIDTILKTEVLKLINNKFNLSDKINEWNDYCYNYYKKLNYKNTNYDTIKINTIQVKINSIKYKDSIKIFYKSKISLDSICITTLISLEYRLNNIFEYFNFVFVYIEGKHYIIEAYINKNNLLDD